MEQFVDENNYPLFDGINGLKQERMSQTAMQELLLKLATQTEKDSFGRRIIQLSIVDKEIVEALEKEKEQSIELIKQTAMFMAASNLDEDISKMSYEDVYNSYYNKNK